MNRRLLDPFQSVQLPEIIEEYLDHGVALCMAFNRRGTLLASGNKEGQVVVWDFETRGEAAVLLGHEGPVTSLSWSRNGRFLLSGSEDQRVILWDMTSCSQAAQMALGSPVLRVSLSPRPPHLAIACLADGPPVLVDFHARRVEPLPMAGDNGDAALTRGGGGGGGPGGGGVSVPSGGSLALFSRQGDTILGCQPRGVLTVVHVASRRVLDAVRLPNSTRVLDLALNRKGTLLLATCQDQRVRLYDVLGATQAGLQAPSDADLAEALASKSIKSGSVLYGDAGLLRPVREFQNAVERTPWRTAAFSCDSEHVVGVSAAKAHHHIYIWNRLLGNMERILEGPKEASVDLAWHPISSILLCCTASGRIYIWAKVQAENWSAFAPDFRELDENAEYVEREDEFDWNTPGARGDLGGGGRAAGGDAAAGGDQQLGSGGSGGDGDGNRGEAEVLDILTREPYYPFSSDDEESVAQELLYLPVVVERELPPSSGGAEGTRQDEDAAQGNEGASAGGAGAEAPGPQGKGQAQAYDIPPQVQHLGRIAVFPRRNTTANGSGELGRRGGGGRQASVATDSGDGGAGSGAVGGDGTDMDEEGWGVQGPGLGLQGPHLSAGAGMEAVLAYQHQQQVQVQQRQLQQQQDLGLQGGILAQQLLLLQQQQGLQGQGMLLQGVQGEAQAVGWAAAAAAMQGALPGGGAGLQDLEGQGGWPGGAAGVGADAEMREAADDTDGVAGGQPGRKRRVQFNDGVLDVRRGR